MSRFYLKLGAAVFVVAVLITGVVFIFRLEKFILQNLPEEISAQTLAVSLWHRGFTVRGVKVHFPQGSPCGGAILGDAGEITGSFNLWRLKLVSVIVSDLRLYEGSLKSQCFVRPPRSKTASFSDMATSEGLTIILKNASLRLTDLGDTSTDAKITVQAGENKSIHLSGDDMVTRGDGLRMDLKKLRISFSVKDEKITNLIADVMGSIRVPNLEKIPRLSTKKLIVLRGEALLKIAADARADSWTLYTSVDLTNIQVKGEPLNQMPLGILEFTPQSVWPMVEDTPGMFRFGFKSKSQQHKLMKTYAADLRKAFIAKIKTNLKKKIPILPF